MTRLLALAALLCAASLPAQRTSVFTTYGTSCGPVLAGTVIPNGNTDKFEIKLTKATPRSHVLFIVGAEKWDIDLRPIFGGTLDCRLYVRPDFFQKHLTDDLGSYVWSHALPSTHLGVAWAQVAELLPNGGVLTSNGLELLSK